MMQNSAHLGESLVMDLESALDAFEYLTLLEC